MRLESKPTGQGQRQWLGGALPVGGKDCKGLEQGIWTQKERIGAKNSTYQINSPLPYSFKDLKKIRHKR